MNTPTTNLSPRYLVCDNWGHLFGPGKSETMTRWVVDCNKADPKIAYAQFLQAGAWRNLREADAADLFESVHDNNVFVDPGEHDAYRSDVVPEWAQGEQLR